MRSGDGDVLVLAAIDDDVHVDDPSDREAKRMDDPKAIGSVHVSFAY